MLPLTADLLQPFVERDGGGREGAEPEVCICIWEGGCRDACLGAAASHCGWGRIDGPTLCCTHSLDQLLDSGLYTGEVTELMGAPGSGKTQVSGTEERKVAVGGTWCLQACKTCPAPNRKPSARGAEGLLKEGRLPSQLGSLGGSQAEAIRGILSLAIVALVIFPWV